MLLKLVAFKMLPTLVLDLTVYFSPRRLLSSYAIMCLISSWCRSDMKVLLGGNLCTLYQAIMRPWLTVIFLVWCLWVWSNWPLSQVAFHVNYHFTMWVQQLLPLLKTLWHFLLKYTSILCTERILPLVLINSTSHSVNIKEVALTLL